MGTTVLFATHDRTLLDVRPRRIVVLDDGKATDVPHGLAEAAADDDLHDEAPSGEHWADDAGSGVRVSA
jgi:cell division transport system ATP-binding protein